MIYIKSDGYDGYRTLDGKLYTIMTSLTACYVVQIDDTDNDVVLSYLYPDKGEAPRALLAWDGIGHPPGRWVSMTGIFEGVPVIEVPNPAFPSEPVP